MKSRYARLVGIPALMLAAVAAGAGVAGAVIPSSDGVIHACYSGSGRPGGQLRVVDVGAGATCSSTETPLTWNQQGPAGPAGPQGPIGPEGPQGDTGPAALPLYRVAGIDRSFDGHNCYYLGNCHVVLASIDVPAGRYAVEASIDLDPSWNQTTYTCEVTVPTVDDGTALRRAQFIDGEGSDEHPLNHISLAVTGTAATPPTITAACNQRFYGYGKFAGTLTVVEVQ